MNQEVNQRVLRRFMTVYGEPNTVDPDGLFEEFSKALGGTRPDILTKGVDRVIKAHTFPAWPTVGEVVKECRLVADELADKFQGKEEPKNTWREPVAPEVAKALMAGFNRTMAAKNTFDDIAARASAWARHHGVSVSVDVSAPWGKEAVDSMGRIVPIGWRANQRDAA